MRITIGVKSVHLASAPGISALYTHYLLSQVDWKRAGINIGGGSNDAKSLGFGSVGEAGICAGEAETGHAGIFQNKGCGEL